MGLNLRLFTIWGLSSVVAVQVAFAQTPPPNRNTAAVQAPANDGVPGNAPSRQLWQQPRVELFRTGVSDVLRCTHFSSELDANGVLAVHSKHIEYVLPPTTVSREVLERQLVYTNPEAVCPPGNPQAPDAYPQDRLAEVRRRAVRAGVHFGNYTEVRSYGNRSSILVVRDNQCNESTGNFQLLSQKQWFGDRYRLQVFCHDAIAAHLRPQREQAQRERDAQIQAETQLGQQRLAQDNARLQRVQQQRAQQERQRNQSIEAARRRTEQARRRAQRAQQQRQREDLEFSNDLPGAGEVDLGAGAF